MNKMITETRDLVGKRITHVHPDVDYFFLRFDDDTIACIPIDCAYDDLIDEQPSGYAEVGLGLISKEEYERLEQENRQRSIAIIEARERKQWEQLNAKYGAKT